MNRSILIVICDFLVSAMLSMMTGMVPAHTGGTGVGLDENTTRLLLSQLEANRRELEKTRNQLREAASRYGSTPEREAELRKLAKAIAENVLKTESVKSSSKRTLANTGKLTAEELQKRLDAEKLRRIELELEVRENKGDLSLVKQILTESQNRLKERSEELKEKVAELKERSQELRERSKELKDQRQENAALRGNLAKTTESLNKSVKEVAESQKKVTEVTARAVAAERDLVAEKQKLASRNADLAGVRDALREMTTRVGQASRQTQKLQNSLAYTTGQLANTERDLADYKGQIGRLSRQLAQVRLEYNEAERRRSEMEVMLKNTASNLTRTGAKLEETERKLSSVETKQAKTEGQLKIATVKLKAAEKRLSTNVIERYAQSAVRLNLELTESRLFLNKKAGGTYYLPLVKFGKQNYVVGFFDTLAGCFNVQMFYSRISHLAYNMGVPESGSYKTKATSLLVFKKDSRVAALNVNVPGRIPIPAISLSQLRKRGIQQLYLFKSDSFGKESTELTGRCSLDLTGKDPYLTIRSAARGGNELKPVPGDLVLTKEGDFVGIVVCRTLADAGKVQEAKALVFTEPEKTWDDAAKVSLTSRNAKGYYKAFADFSLEIRNANADLTEKQINK